MEIPFELSIFSWIYEIGRWIVLTLLLAGLLFSLILPLWRKPVLLLVCVIFPLLFGALNFGVIWCGFHYRMELRDRFARSASGRRDPHSAGPVDIRLMPPEIRAEYAKHGYRPRFRDMKAMVVGTVLLIPFLCALGGVLFGALAYTRKAEGKIRRGP